ncbi:unnamed protein product, partial [Effrenium voratum]
DIFCVELFAGIKTVCGGFKGCGYDATSFEVVFRQRKPSKAELEITLKVFNNEHKDSLERDVTLLANETNFFEDTISDDEGQVGHRAKLEILLRQKAFKPRVRSDGIKVTGEATRSSGPKQCPKPTYVYSNYRMISALYLPLPSNHKWTAEMSVKYEDSCGIRRVAGGADLKKSQHYPKLFGASVAQLWVANKDRFPRWISIFSTCPKSVHAPLGHDPEGGARKTATCINT